MVPLKLDLCDDRSKSVFIRPSLVLTDCTSAPRKRSAFVGLENALLGAAAAAAMGYFLVSSGSSLINTVQQNYAGQSQPQTVVISRAVKRGDTLASLARRYGNPSTYILKREEQIALANHLTGTEPLFPGQHLQIPVTNPAVIAQIVRSSHHALVASRG